MKRILTQKDNPIPTCAVDNCAVVENIKPIPPEVNRRVRTSAAMLGLAISMGASSLLLPQQSDGAMAAEPTDSSVVPTVPAPVTEAAPTPTPEVKSVKTTVLSTLKPLGLGHKVQDSNSISSETPMYRVEPRAFTQPIAEPGTATFNPQSSRFSPPAKTTISALKGSIQELKAGDRVAAQSEFYGVAPDRVGQSAAQEASASVSVSEPVTVPGYVGEQLKVKQTVALNRLKESSNRLRSSLAEWKSEESTSSFAQGTELPQPTVVPNSIQPIAEKPSGVTETFNRFPKASVAASTVAAPEVLTNTAQFHKLRQATVASDVPQVVLPEPAETNAPVSLLYQVKPGDTLGEIARNYGVSPTVLAQANDLSNPNRLKVSQMLAIPSSQPTSATSESIAYLPASEKLPKPEPLATNAVLSTPLVPASTPTLPVVSALAPNADASRDEGPTVPVPNWEAGKNGSVSGLGTDAPSQKFNGELASVPNQPSSLTKQLAASDRKSADATAIEVPEAFEPGTTTVAADSALKKSSDSRSKNHYSPYVERLRAEIFQLREQYRTQQASETPSPNAQRYSAASIDNSASSSYEPVNPEFNPNRYNEALQAEIRKRSEQQPVQRVQTRTPLPEPTTTARSRSQQQLLATAPAGPEAYQPFNQSLPGRLVSPELPPLNAPDNYLPNGINQNFNGYMWPTKGVITSGFGRRWGRMHKGIDIAAPTGTPIFAAAPGIVVYARYNNGGYGNLVDIKHADGSLTRYGHNSRILVQEGQYVEQGQQIAAMGSTGRSTGPHCHFEVHPPGQGAVNPIAFLPRR